MPAPTVLHIKARWRHPWLVNVACWTAIGASLVDVPPRTCARIASTILRLTPIDVSVSGSGKRICSFVPSVEVGD